MSEMTNRLIIGNLVDLPTEGVAAQKAQALAHNAITKDGLERTHVAQEFASFLYLEVLKAMRATIPKDGLFENNSLSRDVYTSMLDTEVARVLAKRDATGFTRTVQHAIDSISPKVADKAILNPPVTGTVSSGFGMRYDPIHGTRTFHKGVDIAAPDGAEVVAPMGGRVIFSGPAPGYGNLVEIDHGNGLVTRYGHNASNLVSAGDDVLPGDPIAVVGSTGRATAAHLHFEVREGGKPVDPSIIIGRAVRGARISRMA